MIDIYYLRWSLIDPKPLAAQPAKGAFLNLPFPHSWGIFNTLFNTPSALVCKYLVISICFPKGWWPHNLKVVSSNLAPATKWNIIIMGVFVKPKTSHNVRPLGRNHLVHCCTHIFANTALELDLNFTTTTIRHMPSDNLQFIISSLRKWRSKVQRS